MTFSKYREQTSELFTSLTIINIYELNKYFIALFMSIFFNGKLLSNFQGYFSKKRGTTLLQHTISFKGTF